VAPAKVMVCVFRPAPSERVAAVLTLAAGNGAPAPVIPPRAVVIVGRSHRRAYR